MIKRGVLVKGPCEDCGGTKDIEAHHDDYAKPRIVRWKCRRCHLEFHEKQKLTATHATAHNSFRSDTL